MDYYNYNNRGSPRLLTSFGLMLASGFGALSRMLFGICGPRRGGGCDPYRSRDDAGGTPYCNRDGGCTSSWNRGSGGSTWNMDSGSSVYPNGDNCCGNPYLNVDGGSAYNCGSPYRNQDGGYVFRNNGYACGDDGNAQQGSGYERRQESEWQQYGPWRNL